MPAGSSAHGVNPASAFVRCSSAQANKAQSLFVLSFPLFRPFKVCSTSRGEVIAPHAEGGDVKSPSYARHTGCRVGDVAQLGEHLLCKQGVGGSSPPISTTHIDNRIESIEIFQNVESAVSFVCT